jgi:hypothetical protein
MAATLRILPDPGYRDGLGSGTAPWAEIWATEIFLGGNPVASRPIDAGWIENGTLPPQRVASLLSTTVLDGTARSLAAISADAALGASDPIARINAGVTLLTGSKIAAGSIPPSALNDNGAVETTWVGTFRVDDHAGFYSADWDTFSEETGWRLEGLTPRFNRGLWNSEVSKGPITVGGFFLATTGQGHVGTAGFGPSTDGFNWDTVGRLWWGTGDYPSAPTQFDPLGNFYLQDSPNSLSKIDLGAIDAYVRQSTPSVVGGAYAGNITFIPGTRGSSTYYTLDGTDPSELTNVSRTLYTGPVNINPLTGVPVTLKTVAYKLGVQSTVGTWIFTYPPDASGAVSSPVFDPIGGYYFPSDGQLLVSLSSNTVGATIRYTTDGSSPTGASAVYVGAIICPVGTTTIKAFAQKAGLVDSNERDAVFVVATGSGNPGSGDPNPNGGGGHGNVP